MVLRRDYWTHEKLAKYEVLGKGVYGTVYKVNDFICVKVNSNSEINQKEVDLYKKYRDTYLFPQMYQSGENYIILELIKGKSLRTYLDEGNQLNERLLMELIKMLESGLEMGLTLNPNARHVILTHSGRIRLVDLEDIVKFASGKPFMLLHRFREYNQRDTFMDFVKKHNRRLYKKWVPEKC